jgi:hypothetical protein
MLLDRFGFRTATAIRLIGLGLIVWSVVVSANRHPVAGGRSVVVIAALAVAVIAYLVWTVQPSEPTVTPDLYVMAGAGGLLIGASPGSGASAFVFVAVVVAALRVELSRTLPLLLVSILALAISVLIYKLSAVGMLAYALGFSAGLLAASGRRQSVERAEQAELLLARLSAPRKRSSARRGWRSRPGSRARSTTSWRTPSPASRSSSKRPAR